MGDCERELTRDLSDLQVAIRREAHCGDRVVNCFADCPSNDFDMISRAASQNPDGEALKFNDIRLTWRQLERKSIGFAKGLASHGVKPRDRLLLLLGNRTEFVIAFLACAKIGAIIVPVNVRVQRDALRQLVQHSGASAILHERSLVEVLPTKAEAPDVSFRICPEACEGSITFFDVYADDEISPETVIFEEGTRSINYTSGTCSRKMASWSSTAAWRIRPMSSK
jgi:acyl-CoA synthetase (AMP-forming)/AMP-acid ligase II